MLLSWARAEIPGRWRATAPIALSKLEPGAELSAEDVAEIERFMLRVRGDIAPLLAAHTVWFRAALPIGDLGSILVDPYWTWTSLGVAQGGACAPWRSPAPRTMADLTANEDAPALTFSRPFDFAAMCGEPICITRSLEGSLRVIEGSNRVRGAWAEHVQGRTTPASLRMIVGVHPDPDAFKFGHLCLALGRVGWTNDAQQRAVVAETDDSLRPCFLACPNTRRATLISKEVFLAFRALGFPTTRPGDLGGLTWMG